MDQLFIEAVKSIYDFDDQEVMIYLKGFQKETIDKKTEEFKKAVKKVWYTREA